MYEPQHVKPCTLVHFILPHHLSAQVSRRSAYTPLAVCYTFCISGCLTVFGDDPNCPGHCPTALLQPLHRDPTVCPISSWFCTHFGVHSNTAACKNNVTAASDVCLSSVWVFGLNGVIDTPPLANVNALFHVCNDDPHSYTHVLLHGLQW